MPEEAIHAGSDAIFASYRKLQEKPQIKREKSRQERVSNLDKSDSWKAISETIDIYIQSLKDLRGITSNDTVEAVGFRFLASQLAIEYLENVKELPSRAAKALKKDE